MAAYLLKKKGFKVMGFTLKFYPGQNSCCDWESLYQAKRVCQRLGIPHYTIDSTDLFKKEIIDYFIASYLEGLTPNPCAFCNRMIKFGFFLEKVRSFGADYLATGHYARIARSKKRYFLKVNKDKKKSQEYFLSLIDPAILKHLIFPLGNYTKEKVKKIAKAKKIIFKPKKESQDVCFVQDKYYPEFIEENITDHHKQRGYIKHVSGKVLGKHKGIYYYTYGQRSGLGVSWTHPLYVTNVDPETKDVIVAEKNLFCRNSFFVHSFNWFLSPKKYKDIKVKVRYNSAPLSCNLRFIDDRVEVKLEKKIDFLAPGQIAAFYRKDTLLGAGIIEKS